MSVLSVRGEEDVLLKTRLLMRHEEPEGADATLASHVESYDVGFAAALDP
mgnify:FL=1